MRRVCGFVLVAAALPGFAAQGDAAKVFAKAKDAVVTITTPSGSGTGFVIGDGTLLVTCHHIISTDLKSSNPYRDIPYRASLISLSLEGIVVASVYAYDAEKDIAILKLNRPAPKRLTLLESGTLNPGTKIFVIGTALGFLEQTITEGIVSGVRETHSGSLLQITAAISPGSSGSPVLTASGKVAGVVVGSLEEGQSLNFAVPADEVHALLRSRARATNIDFEKLRESYEANKAARIKDLVGKLDGRWGDEAARKLSGMSTEGVLALSAAAREGNPAVRGRAVDGLIRALADTDSSVLRSAALALGVIGDKRAVGPLIRALADTDSWVRRSAAWALGHIGDSAVEPLIQALADTDSWVRSSAAGALGHIGDKRAVEPLIRVLADSDPDVRWSAAWALGLIGDSAVEPLIRALADSDSWVRMYAALALGYIGDKRAVEPLIRALADSHHSVRMDAASALGRIGDKRALQALRRVLNDPDQHVRAAAREAIRKIEGRLSSSQLTCLVRATASEKGAHCLLNLGE